MFRLPFLILVSLAIAFGVGAWSASATLKATSGFGAIRLGPWSAYPELQTAKADPFAKAHRAGDGRILLGRAEGLVFTARSDQEGAPLSGLCSYRISGSTPPARFWTLRVALADGAPAPATAGFPHSLTSWNTLRGADGEFEITVSPQPVSGNWIRLAAQGEIAIVLTLIDTPTAGSVGLVELDMPSISKVRCSDA